MLIIVTVVIIIINYFSLMTICPPITEMDPIVLPNAKLETKMTKPAPRHSFA